MSLQLVAVPFLDGAQSIFGPESRREDQSGLIRLINETKSYVFTPLEDDFEKQTQQKERQLEQQGIQGDVETLYSEMMELRAAERAEMIRRGYLDDENSRRSLENAISFRGTCMDMCPVFERVKRTRQNNVNASEKDPTTGCISPERAIKSFVRPAAGQEPPLPSDVRPPKVLVLTLDYMVANLVDRLPDAHSFIWDRTRSIRQDFTFQNYFGPETIDCNERIARIHILLLHIMAGSDVEYLQQQELEQLEKTLKTLSEMYDEYRKKGFPQPPNEAEFRAYHILLKLHDPELERCCEKLPSTVFHSDYLQTALQVRRMVAFDRKGGLTLYNSFFKLLFSKIPFLMACLLEVRFNDIRHRALREIVQTHHSRTKKLELLHLLDVLLFPDYKELKQFLSFYEIKWVADSNGSESLVMNTVSNLFKRMTLPNGAPKIMKSAYDARINAKMGNFSRRDIINGPARTDFTIPESTFTPVDVKSHLKPPKSVLLKTTSMSSGSKNGFTLNTEKDSEEELRLERERKKREVLEQKKAEFAKRKREREEQLAREARERQLREEEERRRVVEAEARRQEEERLRQQQLELQRVRAEEARKQAEALALRKEKAKVLANELLDCFLNELVQQTVLEEMALRVRTTNLKRQFIGKIKKVAQQCKAKYDRLQRKVDELLRAESMLGMGVRANPLFKRAAVINNVRSNESLRNSLWKRLSDTKEKAQEKAELIRIQQEIEKQPSREVSMISSVEEKIPMIQRMKQDEKTLWQPLNLEPIVELYGRGGEFKELSFMIILEKWDGLSAKWIRTKFGLDKVSERSVTSKSGTTMLLSGYRDDLVKNTVCVVFECGFNDPKTDYSQPGLAKEKVVNDGKLLFRVADLVAASTSFKFQIVLLFWTDSSLSVSEKDLYNYLGIDKLKKRTKGVLLDLKFCPLDMSDKSPAFVDQDIIKCLLKTAKHFKGDLTSQGTDKLKPALPKKKPDPRPETNNSTRLWRVNSTSVLPFEHSQLENSIVEEHPYFRKYQHYNKLPLVSRKEPSFALSTILPETSLEVPKKRGLSGSISAVKKKPRLGSNLMENPLAHSSMVQSNASFRKGTNSFVNISTLKENNTSQTNEAETNNTGNVTFSLLNSQFNRTMRAPSTKLSLGVNSTFTGLAHRSFQSKSILGQGFQSKPILGRRTGSTKTSTNVQGSLANLKRLVSGVNAKYKKKNV